MTEQQKTRNPGWASQIGSGLYIAAFGCIAIVFGLIAWPLLTSIGGGLIAIGAAISLTGAGHWFLRIRE